MVCCTHCNEDYSAKATVKSWGEPHSFKSALSVQHYIGIAETNCNKMMSTNDETRVVYYSRSPEKELQIKMLAMKCILRVVDRLQIRLMMTVLTVQFSINPRIRKMVKM